MDSPGSRCTTTPPLASAPPPLLLEAPHPNPMPPHPPSWRHRLPTPCPPPPPSWRPCHLPVHQAEAVLDGGGARHAQRIRGGAGHGHAVGRLIAQAPVAHLRPDRGGGGGSAGQHGSSVPSSVHGTEAVASLRHSRRVCRSPLPHAITKTWWRRAGVEKQACTSPRPPARQAHSPSPAGSAAPPPPPAPPRTPPGAPAPLGTGSAQTGAHTGRASACSQHGRRCCWWALQGDTHGCSRMDVHAWCAMHPHPPTHTPPHPKPPRPLPRGAPTAAGGLCSRSAAAAAPPRRPPQWMGRPGPAAAPGRAAGCAGRESTAVPRTWGPGRQGGRGCVWGCRKGRRRGAGRGGGHQGGRHAAA